MAQNAQRMFCKDLRSSRNFNWQYWMDNWGFAKPMNMKHFIWNRCQVKTSFVKLNRCCCYPTLCYTKSIHSIAKRNLFPAKKKLNSNSSIIIKDFKRYSIQINIIQHIKRKRQTEQVHWPDELCTILLSLHFF